MGLIYILKSQLSRNPGAEKQRNRGGFHGGYLFIFACGGVFLFVVHAQECLCAYVCVWRPKQSVKCLLFDKVSQPCCSPTSNNSPVSIPQ